MPARVFPQGPMLAGAPLLAVAPAPQIPDDPVLFSAGPSRSSEASVCRILCYGDSLTAGFFSEGQYFEPYGRTLVEQIGATGRSCEVHICGLNGLTAAEMASGMCGTLVDVCGIHWKGLARVLQEDGPFDLAIIMAGTNDLPNVVTTGALSQNLRCLHNICHEHGVPTLALAPPPIPKQSALWEMDRQLLVRRLDAELTALRCTVACLDPGEIVHAANASLWDADGLHFSQLGSRMLGLGLAQVAMNLACATPGEPDITSAAARYAWTPISKGQLLTKCIASPCLQRHHVHDSRSSRSRGHHGLKSDQGHHGSALTCRRQWKVDPSFGSTSRLIKSF
eukprot:TRINITY_DN27136_c0_g1_i1.p1 TRINITY_DN27136_c0_g1~~TRINITY_DN27136_c0_g1_i1.p1  ORF type:complete len:361 (-),score=39.53 TRINITY_DN27136_c0_g1_i1:63-1073(-)